MNDTSRPLVIGLSLSGRAMVQAFETRGIPVDVHDDFSEVPAPWTSGPIPGLEAAKARLADITLVCVSPGIAPSHVLLQAARSLDIPIWSEPELAIHYNRGRTSLIVVTGTNGKTTTTQLIAHCLDIPSLGNVGTPMMEVLAGDDPPKAAVCELSSFQLHYTHSLRAPIVILTNIAPDHLDWHGGMANYIEAKSHAWSGQEPDDLVLVLSNQPEAQRALSAHAPNGMTRLVVPSSAPPLQLAGPHNQANAALAKAACLAFGMPESLINQRLRAFAPQPHRVQPVGTFGGVTYINDSKATNPHAAQAAIGSFDAIIWIAGGLNKGLSFGAIAPSIRPAGGDVHSGAGSKGAPIKLTLTIGQAGPEIEAMVKEAGGEVIACETMARAVEVAVARAVPGDTVLMAPACASMDQFANYGERGDAFAQAVLALAGESDEA